MNKKVLILGASELQVPAIIAAKENNITSIVVDFDKNATGIRYADEFYNISTLDYDAVLELAKEKNVDGIMTICSDRPMNIVAKVGESLHLNTISVETAIYATNKAAMRNRLDEYHVPIPKYSIIKSIDELMSEYGKYELPFILKPSDNSGSRGIVLVDNENNLKASYEYALKNSYDGVVLLEEYMHGQEVSVEIFVQSGTINVIQVTDKVTTGAPHFVEMGHVQPSMISHEQWEDVECVAKAAVNALGINLGPAHVEIKITESGAKIVEVGARLGGDYITTDLVPLSTGVDMVEATLKTALGMKCDVDCRYKKVSAIKYFSYQHFINLSQNVINSLERMYVNRMEKREIESSRDREGFYILSADTYDELKEKMNLIDNEIL